MDAYTTENQHKKLVHPEKEGFFVLGFSIGVLFGLRARAHQILHPRLTFAIQCSKQTQDVKDFRNSRCIREKLAGGKEFLAVCLINLDFLSQFQKFNF